MPTQQVSNVIEGSSQEPASSQGPPIPTELSAQKLVEDLLESLKTKFFTDFDELAEHIKMFTIPAGFSVLKKKYNDKPRELFWGTNMDDRSVPAS